MKHETNYMPIVRINAPEWYARQDWMNWIESDLPDQRGPATWHRKGQKPDEYSDVFFTYCQGEGSDFPGIPEDIWQAIMVLMQFEGINECLVWVVNF
jgi:hypothetical protein